MPKVKIVGMPTVRIVDLPKALLGLEVDDTTTMDPAEAGFNAFLQPGEHKNIANASYPSTPTTSATNISAVTDKPRDINNCIIGEEQYDLATGVCVPIDGGYSSKQDEQKNQPAIPVTNSSGQTVGGPASTGKTGPGTGVNPSQVVKPGECAKGWHKDSKGNCVPDKKGIQAVNDFTQATLAAGNAFARIAENKQAKEAAEASMRRKSWGSTVKPGGAMAFGKTQLNEGIEFPNMMAPPNDGQYMGNYFGRSMGQFGGSFPTASSGPIKIKIVGEPDSEVMKYGGQSGYGFDSGWKRSYTEMNKISSDYYKSSMSEDKSSDEEPVLEAEGGETIYKPGDQAFFRLNGPKHSQGGIELTGSQVNSKSKDVPSFIYSDTPSLKIKDKNTLEHFGVTYKKGGVTPAEISKKYDLNKFKAILQDPNSDELAKSTAQLMIDKNERRLAELATVQEKMKGLKAPKFAEQTLKEGSAAFGGFMPTYKKGGKTDPDPENDAWIKKILEFEAKQGSSAGKGLNNWGYNSRIGWSDNNTPKDSKDDYAYDLKDPNKKLDINNAIEYFKQDILPKVNSYPLEIRKRLADYSYNTGRSPEDLLLLAAGKITLDDINSAKTFTNEWNANKADILKNASDPTFIAKLNDAKTQVYKTTPDKQNNKHYTLSNPNPAFGSSWQNRINLFDETGQPVTNTQTANGTPAVVTSNGTPAPSNTTIVTNGAPAPTSSGGGKSLGLGEWSDDYEKLQSVLLDDRNKGLRKELFTRYKKQFPNAPVTEDQYVQNLLAAQKQNFAIRAAHGDDKYLQDEDWDKGGKKRNKRYNKEVTALGLTPLTDDEITRFQAGYRDLEKAMHEPQFFETFGKYFRTKQFGKSDEPAYLGKKTISKVDNIYGNTTAGQAFELSGWTDATTTMPVTQTTTIPVEVGPRYMCYPSADGKGGGTVKQLPAGMTGGYSSPEEAAKYCPGPPKKGKFDYLLPDKLNMFAHAAIFPRQIFPFNPDLAFNPRPLALEDWRAKAAQRFSTQYAAPSAQLAQFGPTQGLGANLSFLAGQTGQQMAAEDIAPTISRNIDRVNAYNTSEGQRQDTIDAFNNQNKVKRWEGYATTLQNYDNAMRGYLKENSDAFTRAWKNRMHLGEINDNNPNFLMDPTTGRQTWKGNHFYTGNTSGGDSGDLGKMYSLYYQKNMEDMSSYITDETERKKAARDLAMKQIDSDRYSETTDPYSNKSRKRSSGFDFGS